jgi:transposase
MRSSVDLHQLSEAQLRNLAAQMLNQLSEQDACLAEKETRIAAQDVQLIERDAAIHRYRIRNEQLTHEIALLKRHRFGKRGEAISRQQYSLLEDLVDEDTAAIEQELEQLTEHHRPPEAKPRTPKRGGPHRLDSDWTMISAFLHDEQQARERSNETKETYPFT